MTYLLFFVTTAFLFNICASFIVHPMLNLHTHDTTLNQYINEQTSANPCTNETINDYEIPGWVNRSAFKYNLPNRFKAKQYDKHIDHMLTKRSKSK